MSEHYDRRTADVEVIKLGVEVDSLKTDMAELKADVKCLLAKMNQAKGGWMTLIAVAGIAGSMGALVSKMLPFTGGLPK